LKTPSLRTRQHIGFASDSLQGITRQLARM
jgi:hypothetical protein